MKLKRLHECVGLVLFVLTAKESLDGTGWSTATKIPCLLANAITVELDSTALAAYSTWKMRPSGEKVAAAKSQPVPMELIFQFSFSVKSADLQLIKLTVRFMIAD